MGEGRRVRRLGVGRGAASRGSPRAARRACSVMKNENREKKLYLHIARVDAHELEDERVALRWNHESEYSKPQQQEEVER